ncbi:peptide/nickel transport system permease protein [Paracoccus alcaliphilus]|uniref:Peptide/nickel transport system permease protein n=1 Tax=Paracoccus alcaliphilus TaxID=34002 RepID=A0A1H8HGS9_9RHOB|nr:ABC transporter permease [Paracoccus alcaliphilus]WCR20709.1 ABC transporter permease [Paracoccus alcaliphilus]SEN55249.1 peptide/nickel transport system permease protein [Paracoccus alcaliphilus]
MAGPAPAAFAAPGFRKLLFQRPSVVVALMLFLLIVATCFLLPALGVTSIGGMSVRNRLTPPGAEYMLGADAFGRDVLGRLLVAGQTSLGIGLGVALLSSAAGVVIGLVAGFFRRLDTPLSRLIDAMMAFPDILLALSLVAIFGGSMVNVILALSVVYAPRIARIVRASTLVIRELPYVEAARALGTRTPTIMVTHVLRNILSPIMVQATFIFAYAMLAEAGLSFLGVGVDPKIPTWGIMINEGRQYIDNAFFLILFPGLAIALSVLSLQIVGDGLRDALDPKLAKET